MSFFSPLNAQTLPDSFEVKSAFRAKTLNSVPLSTMTLVVLMLVAVVALYYATEVGFLIMST